MWLPPITWRVKIRKTISNLVLLLEKQAAAPTAKKQEYLFGDLKEAVSHPVVRLGVGVLTNWTAHNAKKPGARSQETGEAWHHKLRNRKNERFGSPKGYKTSGS